jgi:hypothetical protein
MLKQERQQRCWRYGVRVQYYPVATARWEILFAEEEIEKTEWRNGQGL